MWKNINGSNYFLFLTESKDGFEVLITNFISIWSIRYTDSSFLACLLEANFGLEGDNNEELIMAGKKILRNPDCLSSVKISENGVKSLTVSLTVKDADGPLTLKMKLEEGSKELFFQKVTQQLLKTVTDLKNSETELRRTLLRNDKEIELGLKPVPFNVEAHTQKHKAYSDNFGSSIIPEYLLSRTVDVPAPTMYIPDTEIAVVKQEPIEETPEAKLEPQVNIKTEIKIEPKTESQSSMVSTKTSKKRKLNLKY